MSKIHKSTHTNTFNPTGVGICLCENIAIEPPAKSAPDSVESYYAKNNSRLIFLKHSKNANSNQLKKQKEPFRKGKQSEKEMFFLGIFTT